MLYRRRWKSSNFTLNPLVLSRVVWDPWNPVWIHEDHLVRLNIPEWPIAYKYREGKVKRTPVGEWNRTWNQMLTISGKNLNSDRVPVEEWAGELNVVAG